MPADLEIPSVDWSAYMEHDGPATRIGAALHQLLRSMDLDPHPPLGRTLKSQYSRSARSIPLPSGPCPVMLAALRRISRPGAAGGS